MHGVRLGKRLSHLGSLFILQPHPACQPPYPKVGGAEAYWQRPWGGDRLGQQTSALSLPGSGSQSGSGLMGQPPVLVLLQASSLMVPCSKPSTHFPAWY